MEKNDLTKKIPKIGINLKLFKKNSLGNLTEMLPVRNYFWQLKAIEDNNQIFILENESQKYEIRNPSTGKYFWIEFNPENNHCKEKQEKINRYENEIYDLLDNTNAIYA